MLTLCFQGVVGRLLSKAEDNTMLISRFTEYLEMVDVRYYVMSSVRENVGSVMVKSKGVGSSLVQHWEEAHEHCVSGRGCVQIVSLAPIRLWLSAKPFLSSPPLFNFWLLDKVLIWPKNRVRDWGYISDFLCDCSIGHPIQTHHAALWPQITNGIWLQGLKVVIGPIINSNSTFLPYRDTAGAWT